MSFSHFASRFSFVLGLLACATTGCSGEDGEITLEAASTPLSANGNDALVTVQIVHARDGGYPLEGLVVKALRDDAEPVTLACTTNDANKSAKLDTGDTLACAEGGTNAFDGSSGGKEVVIELYATIDGEEVTVGSAAWKPAAPAGE